MKLSSTQSRKPWNSTARLGFDLIEKLCSSKSVKMKNIDQIAEYLTAEMDKHTAERPNRGQVTVHKWFYEKDGVTTFLCGLNRPNSTESCAIIIKYNETR